MLLSIRDLTVVSLAVLAVLFGSFLNNGAQAADDSRVVVIRVSGALLEHVVSDPLRVEALKIGSGLADAAAAGG